MLISRISIQESVTPKEVLNLLTGRWIKTNGKLFQKLIHEGYRCANRLSDYLEDIGTISVGEFELDPLADFYHPALIPPLSTLAERADIREKFIISVESVVMGGVSLFTLEKNKRSSLQNLIQKNYFVKFLHHPNLAPAKYRPGALYDAFSRTNVLGPKHVLALARTFY